MKKFQIALVALSLAAGACGGGETGDGGESTTGGETAASYEGAIASTDVATGQQVYADFCSGCHQDGDGGPGAAPAVNGLGWSAAQMRQQVREGEDDMPAFSESTLPADQLEALLAHLQSTGAVSN